MISNALRAKSADEIAAGRKRIQALYESRHDVLEDPWKAAGLDQNAGEAAETSGADVAAASSGDDVAATDPVRTGGSGKDHEVLLARSRQLLGGMHEEDREKAIDLNEQIEAVSHGRYGGAAPRVASARGAPVLRRGSPSFAAERRMTNCRKHRRARRSWSL
jgi:hypothetical protein